MTMFKEGAVTPGATLNSKTPDEVYARYVELRAAYDERREKAASHLKDTLHGAFGLNDDQLVAKVSRTSSFRCENGERVLGQEFVRAVLAGPGINPYANARLALISDERVDAMPRVTQQDVKYFDLPTDPLFEI